MDMERLQCAINDGLVKEVKHPRLPITLYSYTKECQFEDAWDDVTLQCRGLVLNSQGKRLNAPFNKFFNATENHAPKNINWATARFFEKVDGSCVFVFKLGDGTPIVHTRGSFLSDQSFEARKWLMDNYGFSWMREGWTYAFEWIAPDNRVVVDYKERRELVLLASNDIEGRTRTPEDVPEWQGSRAWEYNFTNIQNAAELLDLVEDDEEGFVVVLDTGERVKVKGARYLELHRTLFGLSSYTIWSRLSEGGGVCDIVNLLQGEEEILEWVEETAEQFWDDVSELTLRIEAFVANLTEEQQEDRGAFARHVHENLPKHLHGAAFAQYDDQEERMTRNLWNVVKPKSKEAAWRT